MKILIASLFFPQFSATHAGGRFVAELVKELAGRHEVHLAARVEETELKSVEEMKPYCKEIFLFPYKKVQHRGPMTSLRLVASYLRFSFRLNDIIRSGQYDLVQAEWVETAVLMKKTVTPMVLDAHDVITKPAERTAANQQGAARFFYYLLYKLIREIELRTMKKFDLVVTRAEYDKRFVLSMNRELPVTVVPHPAGLDISANTYERQKNTILFLASFKHRKKNVEAALYFYQQVFPLVRARIPEARFIIAGYGPPSELTELAKDPAVTVPGFVNDIDECYKKAAVFVAPILVGGGIIVKILDALAAGTPVVCTSYGNEGIGAVSGTHLIIADDPETFSGAVTKILTDAEYALRLGKNGQDYVEKQFSREAVFSNMETLYRDFKRRSAINMTDKE